MSKGNIILLILLVLSLGYVGQIQYTKYQKNQEEIKLSQKRSPVCYNTGKYKVLRFFKKDYYHFVYIEKDNIVGYFKSLENSAFVEFLELYPDKKTSCPKVLTINLAAKDELRREDILIDLAYILKQLDML